MSKLKLATAAIAATAGLAIAGGGIALAQEDGPGGGRRGMGRGFGRGHHGEAWIRIVVLGLIVAAIVGLIIWLATRGRRTGTATVATTGPATVSPTAHAESILAERLARSEISVDDYRSLRAALVGSEQPAPPTL